MTEKIIGRVNNEKKQPASNKTSQHQVNNGEVSGQINKDPSGTAQKSRPIGRTNNEKRDKPSR